MTIRNVGAGWLSNSLDSSGDIVTSLSEAGRPPCLLLSGGAVLAKQQEQCQTLVADFNPWRGTVT